MNRPPVGSTDTVVLSTVSHRGGVGKTTLAVNMAIELASKAKVALVDCDASGRGATDWLRKLVSQDNDDLLTVDRIAELQIDPQCSSLSPRIARINFLSEDKPALEKFRLYFVPLCLHAYPKFVVAPQVDWGTIASDLLSAASEQDFDYVIFDCNPGILDSTIACCSNSDVVVVVTTYLASDMYQSAVFALVTEAHTRRKSHWRAVANKLPSSDLYEVALARWDDAVQQAIEFARSRGIDPSLEAKLEIAIPDLEEFRDHERMDSEDPSKILSSGRRGGNAFIVACHILLEALDCDGLLQKSRRPHFFHLGRKAFSANRDRYYKSYVDQRGFGKAGLERPWFWCSLAFSILSFVYLLLYLVSVSITPDDPPYLQYTIVGLELVLFLSGLGAIVRIFLDFKRALAASEVFEQFYDGRADESTFSKAYNDGGNRATTSNVWWPRLVWFLGFMPIWAFIEIKWAMEVYAHLVFKHGEVLFGLGREVIPTDLKLGALALSFITFVGSLVRFGYKERKSVMRIFGLVGHAVKKKFYK